MNRISFHKLSHDFFNRPTLNVARDLLGKFIVRNVHRRNIVAMITEVEAYKGPQDRACHGYAWRRTPRLEPLYDDGGTVYVYLIYGIHWLLNFSSAGKDKPEGILIRGIMAAPDQERKMIVGPGRVTRYLQINKKQDGKHITELKEMWLEDRGVRIPAGNIQKGPRIGIDYAGPYWAARPWRFWIKPE